MPTKTEENARRWWIAVVAAGPGWVILGALKQLGGAFLAFYVDRRGRREQGATSRSSSSSPASTSFLPYTLALGLAVFFVVLSR